MAQQVITHLLIELKFQVDTFSWLEQVIFVPPLFETLSRTTGYVLQGAPNSKGIIDFATLLLVWPAILKTTGWADTPFSFTVPADFTVTLVSSVFLTIDHYSSPSRWCLVLFSRLMTVNSPSRWCLLFFSPLSDYYTSVTLVSCIILTIDYGHFTITLVSSIFLTIDYYTYAKNAKDKWASTSTTITRQLFHIIPNQFPLLWQKFWF